MKKPKSLKSHAFFVNPPSVLYLEDAPKYFSAFCIQIPAYLVKKVMALSFQKFQKVSVAFAKSVG